MEELLIHLFIYAFRAWGLTEAPALSLCEQMNIYLIYNTKTWKTDTFTQIVVQKLKLLLYMCTFFSCNAFTFNMTNG